MKFSTRVMLFIVVSSSMIGAADAAGMWDSWGIHPETGVSDQIDETTAEFDNVTTGNLGLQTLVGSFAVGASSLATGWKIVTALPTFLENIGVPDFIADIPTAVLGILVSRDVLQIFLGRRV